MYTTGTATKPRRKPATYGKASRRTLQTYHSIPSDKVKEYYGGDDTGDNKKTIGQVRKVGPPQAPKAHSETPPASIGTYKPQGVVRERARDTSTTPGSTATPSVASAENNNIYDVPSSDDDSASSLELGVIGSRKRRKVANLGTKEVSDVVWDDASLQQHIAAEMGEAAPRLISLLGSQSSTISQSSTARPKPDLKSTGRPREQSKICSSHLASSKTAKVTKRTAIPTGMDQPSPPNVRQNMPAAQHGTKVQSRATNLPLSKGVLDPPITGTRTRRQPTIPTADLITSTIRVDAPRTPQKPSARTDNLIAIRGVQTPPLKDAARLSTPGQLNILGLHIKSAFKVPEQARTLSTDSYLGHRLQHAATPRTKLKDRLHGGSKSAQLSKENKDDDSDDDSDARSSFSSTQDMPINQILRRNEAKVLHNISREGSQQPSSSQPVPRIQSGGPKITYSRQRSYLTESDVNEAELLTLSEFGSQEASSGRSRTRPGPPKLQTLQGLSEGMDEVPDSQAGAPKSIHELREAGTNARLLRDIEALLDDIDSGNSVPIALKRSGLLDIATKLQQPEFCRRFLDHSLETRLFTQLGKNTDAVANILFMAAMLPIVAHSSSPHVLSQLLDRRVVDFLGGHLENAHDLASIVRSRELKMSKALQADIGSFCASLLVSGAWRCGQPSQITGRVVSLQCLEYLVRHLREAGSTSDLLPQTVVEKLVDILALSQEASSSVSEKSHVTDCQLALSVLESSTITQPVSSDVEHLPWSIESIEKMERFLPYLQKCSGEKVEKLQTLALRLCLNLTNNSRSRCEAFSTPKIIHNSSLFIETSFQNLSAGLTGDCRALTMDNLVLSLGLLINLAEWSQSSRELYTTKHGATAPPLDTLSRLFQANLARTSEAISEQESVLNVAFGYLSVLLCFLSISTSVKKRLCSLLPGNDLRQVLGAVEEFLQFHRQIDEIQQSDEQVDLKVSFVHRLQTVVDRLKGQGR
ncbi:hypothetical protein MMC30_005524 [Trapelia coarctata]|nr:hypothetical protein [Trapelia coarctata]